jgi:predicted nucleic acid-binding protein
VKVLLDTNVVLDVLLSRLPWVAEAESLWRAAADGHLICCVFASAVTDIYYISRRLVGKEAAREVVRQCLQVLAILPGGEKELAGAYSLPLDDLEDALQVACASESHCEAIVTRDPAGFAGAAVAVLSPSELNARLRQQRPGTRSDGP